MRLYARRSVPLVLILGGVLILGAVALRAARRHIALLPPNAPLPVSLWYWHQPFRLSDAETARLIGQNITELFVRDGTFFRDGETGAIRLGLPQVWATPAKRLTVHLVFNYDYGIVRRLDEIPPETLIATVAETVQKEMARASATGIRVTGVQFDLDCPTRQLPRYAAFLRGVRQRLGAALEGKTFSITALPTWLGSRELRPVSDSVDFIVPQFYESQIPRSLQKFATISDEKRLQRGLRTAGRMGIPFRAGLPAYGHALVFDNKGDLRGAFHDASVLDMARRTSEFRITRAYPAAAGGAPAGSESAYVGEDIVEFGPARPARLPSSDFHLIYDLPGATLPARQIALVRANRPVHCAGVILYRYPERDPTQAVPLPTLLSVLRGETPAPRLQVKVWSRPRSPWQRIEAENGEPAEPAEKDIFASVTNVGDGATGVAPNAVELLLRLNRPGGLREVEPGGFLSAEALGGTGQRGSLARASALQFHTLRLGPGETCIAGPLRVATDVSVSGGAWRALGTGGYHPVTGTFSLNPPAPSPGSPKATPHP